MDKSVNFEEEWIGEKEKEEVDEMKEGEVMIMENKSLKKGEEKKDNELVKEMEENGDIYVKDEF